VNIPSADMDVSVGETHRGWSSQWLGKYIDWTILAGLQWARVFASFEFLTAV
jgi:hypothetical protein